MKPLLLLLTAGLLCNLWPFSSRSVQRNAPAYVPQTTMEKLEAHVWVKYDTEKGMDQGYTTYLAFQNDTLYERICDYGKWYPVYSWPFYFFTPGFENLIDRHITYDTFSLFMPERMGEKLNGQDIVLNGSLIRRHFNSRVSSRSIHIAYLTDKTLGIQYTEYYPNEWGKPSPAIHHFIATDRPFPTNEVLKTRYGIVNPPVNKGLMVIRPDDYSGASNTMDSLEAHTWFTETHWDPYGDCITYRLFRHDTIFTRTRHSGRWKDLQQEPFYFFTPGVENKDDQDTDRRDTTILYFIPERMGFNKIGKHIVYQYSIAGQPEWYYLQRLINTASFEILHLTDSTLITQATGYYRPLVSPPVPQSWHATTSPFPWDENLKYFDYPVKEEEKEEEPQEKAGRKRRKKG